MEHCIEHGIRTVWMENIETIGGKRRRRRSFRSMKYVGIRLGEKRDLKRDGKKVQKAVIFQLQSRFKKRRKR